MIFYNKTMKNIHVDVYTDGACSGNPGIGGWGFVLLYGTHKKEGSGFEKDTTNNRMELMAVIKALEQLKMPCDVTLYSDSAYVVNAFLQNWVVSWEMNDWKNASKQAVKNVDLWQRVLYFTTIHNITWVKVKGHADNEYNNRCDKLATSAITKAKVSV